MLDTYEIPSPHEPSSEQSVPKGTTPAWHQKHFDGEKAGVRDRERPLVQREKPDGELLVVGEAAARRERREGHGELEELAQAGLAHRGERGSEERGLLLVPVRGLELAVPQDR